LRAGFVTEALRLKHELFDIMDLTGHKSVQTVKLPSAPDARDPLCGPTPGVMGSLAGEFFTQ
jgi:hypothetical protein